MTVLFSSNRPIGRAENITAVWEAYRGAKEFTILDTWRSSAEIRAGGYDLLVTDEFPSESKAPVIMIGHGMAGGKTYGFDQPHRYVRREEAKMLARIITSSRCAVDLVAQQSGVPKEKVLPYGMPRTDAYIGKKKGDGGTWLAEKRAYLYAPTFRNMHESDAPPVDWDLIDRLLSDDEVFVIKNHMVTGMLPMDSYKHIVQVSPETPSTPYLIDCDVLITDYSSILFDAHLLNKPVVLFEKDFEAYQKERGMYRPYPQGYASRHTRDEKDLVRIARVAKKQSQEDIRCKRECASACDGKSTIRVIKLIEDLLNGYEEAL